MGVWRVPACGLRKVQAYSCLSDLSVSTCKCAPRWGLGISPGWAVISRVSQEPWSDEAVGRTPSLTVFFWLAGCLGKKQKNPTRLPDFDSLAQTVLLEALGAGLLVTSRCTWAWLHRGSRKGLCWLVCGGGPSGLARVCCFPEMLRRQRSFNLPSTASSGETP